MWTLTGCCVHLWRLLHVSLGAIEVERKAQTLLKSPLCLDDAFKYNIYFLQHISQTPNESHLRIMKRKKRLQKGKEQKHSSKTKKSEL